MHISKEIKESKNLQENFFTYLIIYKLDFWNENKIFQRKNFFFER